MTHQVGPSSCQIYYIIILNYKGVTRDRLFVRCYWGHREFLLIDTGGIPNKTTINDLEKKSKLIDSIIINDDEIMSTKDNKNDIPEGIENQARLYLIKLFKLVLLVGFCTNGI